MITNRSAMELSGISENQPTPYQTEHGRSAGSVGVKSSRLTSRLLVSSQQVLRVCEILDGERPRVKLVMQQPLPGRLIKSPARSERSRLTITCASMKPPPPTTHESAYQAWMSGGSVGLGHWLANYKEHTTKRRNFTTDEYACWVAECRAEERRMTGENNEFCQPRH
jgi:hypothetical protein